MTARNFSQASLFILTDFTKENVMGRGILLWLLGVPIPIIIILLLIFHH